MNTDVTVTANESGQVINLSKNNPVWGWIRVSQSRTTINDMGWAEMTQLSALIHGKVVTLENLKYTANQTLPGKIRIVERMKPFNKKNINKNLKIAGPTGIICSIDDEPIYRNCFYSAKGDEDILLAHDNTDEIKAMLSELKLAEDNEEPDLS